ncbi:mitochondrial fission ELM1 family protein [Desulfurivibrio sp. D14AmB]|uniref:mitochondrial fission ELM1 family protein n=1 Tax=Desulfurivibrio sp. D14AmB TaxID=3374370 RepID=UPI00376EC560
MPPSKNLTITAYFDGRPGHEKQTKALIRALGRLTPVNTTEVRLTGAPPADHHRPPRGAGDGKGAAADLLIGSGRRTHLPLLLAKLRSRGRSRAICCMNPNILLRGLFDLCLVPAHDGVRAGANIFPTDGPPCLTTDQGRHETNHSLLLIGGLDPKSHFWDQTQVLHQAQTLLDQRPDQHWTISSSPRTPPATVAELAELAATRERVQFWPAPATPPGWIEEQYDRHREVWVTADSISMVYEALSAGCRVGIMPVKWRRQQNKFQRGLDLLRQRGQIIYLAERLAGKKFPPAVAPLVEAERCAKEILGRWWPERLS